MVDSKISRINSCRICGNEMLTDILSLGNQYVSDFLRDDESQETLKAPLDLVLCSADEGGCGLPQLAHTVDQDYLYREYWYKSGINESMVESLEDIAKSGQVIADIEPGDTVIDIGCNDGTLLECFEDDLELIGFEPARNLVDEARAGASRIFNDFFNAEIYLREYPDCSADLITSIAMFYDLDDPNEFVKDIRTCLADDGVWIIQMGYLVDKLKNNAFDCICHEHLEYYSLFALENLLTRHDMSVIDMKTNDVNGGSFRVYVAKEGADVEPFEGANERLDRYRERESSIGLESKDVYQNFATRVEQLKERTYEFVEEAVDRGESVYVYGASTKGNTLLQYYGLSNDLIDGAAERNPDKYGLKTVGTEIPIVPEAEARSEADYFLALPWHFMDVFIERESEFLRNGGEFIVPLPEFEVIGSEALVEHAVESTD